MKDTDWTYAGLAGMAGLVGGLAVSLASHWIFGVALCVIWLYVLAKTEGFHVIPGVADAEQFQAELK